MLTDMHGLVQMVMSQLMNNANFNNMRIEMQGDPGFRYRYRNPSPRAQQPPVMQGPPGRHSYVPGSPIINSSQALDPNLRGKRSASMMSPFRSI